MTAQPAIPAITRKSAAYYRNRIADIREDIADMEATLAQYGDTWTLKQHARYYEDLTDALNTIARLKAQMNWA